MNQDQLTQILDDLVTKHGAEDVVAALAQATLNQAERMSGMGHELPAQEMVALAEALVGITSVVEGGETSLASA